MTKSEAIQILNGCKLVAERLDQVVNSNNTVMGKTNFSLSQEDRQTLIGYRTVQSDPIAAGPGLFNKLVKQAELNQVNIFRIEQLIRLITKAPSVQQATRKLTYTSHR
jgi:hypothetical protein